MHERIMVHSDRKDIFVNREGPKKTFAEAVQKIPKDKAIIRVFYGIGGQGKSALCRELYQSKDLAYGHLKRACLDLRDQWSIDALVLLIRIRNSFAETGVSFATFDLALALFWEVARSEQSLPSFVDAWIGRTSGSVADFAPDVVQTVREACEQTVEMIPGLGIVATKLTNWGIDKAKNSRLKRIRPDVVGMLFNNDEVKQPHELEKLLPWFLAQDLNYHLEKNSGNRFVLFLDEYEGLFSQNNRWQENPFDNHIRLLIQESNALLAVFFSRKELPWNDDVKWKADLEGVQYKLDGLETGFAHEWLCAIPISDEKIRLAMISGAREERTDESRVLPFLLELQINYWRQLTQKGSSISSYLFDVTAEHYEQRCSELVNRLLRSYDERLCNTLKRLSVANRFDQGAFEAVIVKTGLAPDDFKKLASLSFIKKGSDGFLTMHQATADAIYKVTDDETRDTSIDLLLTHYENRVQETLVRDVTDETINALFEAAYLREKCGIEDYVGWLFQRAEVITKSARFAQVEQLWRDALSMSQGKWGEYHEDTAASYNNLASILDGQGRYEEAEVFVQTGLKINKRVLGDYYTDTAASYNNVASNLDGQGRYKEAEPFYQRGLEINERIHGRDHPSTASSYNNFGTNLNAQYRYKDAETFYQRGLEIRQKVLGEDHSSTAASYNNVATNLNAQGRNAEAEPLLKKSLKILQKVLGDDHPLTATSYNNVGYNLYIQERYEEAAPFYQKGLEIRRKVLGEDHPSTASSYNNMGANLNAQGRYEEAEHLLSKAYEISKRLLGGRHPQTVSLRENWDYIQRVLSSGRGGS